MIFLLLSMIAYADSCKNIIDLSDATKMIAGQSTGKQYLKCDEKDCICIDGVIFEESKISVDEKGVSKIVVDNEKKAARDKEIADAAKIRSDLVKQLHDGTISYSDLLKLITPMFP